MQEAPALKTLLKAAPPAPAAGPSGLSSSFLTDLSLRLFARRGQLKLYEAAQLMGLGVPEVGELLHTMRGLSLLEVPQRGQFEGDVSYVLTDAGQRQARLAFEKCQYVGPAPVTLPEYVAQVREQSQGQAPVRAESLRQAMQGMVIDPDLLPTIGGALNSGKSIYLYGGSGTGKTLLAEHMVKTLAGHIWVPHAVMVDGEVIQVFDPIVHRRVPLAAVPDRGLARDLASDGRWVRTERPVVIAGGELTLDTLDLAYDHHTRVHVAPPQMKANNGIFVVDDLGRQRVSVHELMNRWIVPLDRHVDYLCLNTGTKFSVPFDVRVVFSSNLAPDQLVDPAFARRLGYKIHMASMNAASYRAVVELACAKTGVPPDAAAIDYLVDTLHARHQQPYVPCVPFDVISKVVDRARYLEQPPRLSAELLDWAWAAYFGAQAPANSGG